MKLFDYIDKDVFEQCLNDKYIKVVSHPNIEGLRIINYTQQCNADKYWNDTTIKCRGLIVDKDDNIIARPFKKFFNYEEHELYDCLMSIEDIDELSKEYKIEIHDKLDGSLGILYWIDDVPYIATKGSFDSEQALHATHLLHTKYRHNWNELLRNKTYLFEIIYPKDMHVVNYNNVDDIFLLAVLSTNNNFEYPPEIYKTSFPLATKYYVNDWKNCRDIIDGNNREGFVVKIGPLRIKMKYKEYWKIYSLKSGVSEKMIYQCLVCGDMTPIENALKYFDEEQVIYYNNIIDKYISKYADITDKCIEEYQSNFKTRKEAAEYFKHCKYPNIMFALYSNNQKAVKNATWKYVLQEVKN